MPKIIQDENGTDIEVFTADELQSQKDAALEDFKKANPDKTEEITKLQKELQGLKDKDFNFANLRKKEDDAQAKIEALKQEIDQKIGVAKKEVLDGVMKDHYNETLKNLAGNDVELLKKIELHYNRIQDPTVTKEDVNKKMRDAWVLATKQDDPGALNSAVISSGGVSRLNIKSDKKFSSDEKAMAQKLAQAGGFALDEKDFN